MLGIGCWVSTCKYLFEIDVTDCSGGEHSMLAPFTAGWQMKAGVPLVIERGEVFRPHPSLIATRFT